VSAYPFLKGHGTENDFVLLPDHDGSIHGDLTVERARALCDRRAGIGGDGVMRVIRTLALAEFDQTILEISEPDPEWFMDYRNSDGSLSEMCGNGIRVFARHLAEAGLIDTSTPVAIGTRAGVRTVTFSAETDLITVDMGRPVLGRESKVGVGAGENAQTWKATNIDMGNPHAVAFVESLDQIGTLLDEPDYDRAVYPEGVNVEFVVRRGAQHVAMRVHERGSGETRSCGTGACAVMVAAAISDRFAPAGSGPAGDVTYRVDVPGGELSITWTQADRVLLTGPAVLVAEGTTSL
jgi:diaminopimelate epimerase